MVLVGIVSLFADAMLSHATHETGRGWAFGLHEALDQTGAMLGPLIVAGVLYVHGAYEPAFAFLRNSGHASRCNSRPFLCSWP